jgi:APA family basic amino acid/polyamine antiporter
MFQRKSLEVLLAEMAGENRLRRVLGPVSLTSLGVGAIIGAGIFAITGRVAAEDAGPGIMISFVIAGAACTFAALCYAEFASMAPVAGSAYTYTYATLGEIWAWIIGWDLVLEYAMSCSVVAAHWSSYLNEFIKTSSTFLGADKAWEIPVRFLNDPFTQVMVSGQPVNGFMNLPAIVIMGLITVILVLGIRESATTNAVLVVIKVAVVIFVIIVGVGYINKDNWTKLPVEKRRETDVADLVERNPKLKASLPPNAVTTSMSGAELLEKYPNVQQQLVADQVAKIEAVPATELDDFLKRSPGIKASLPPDAVTAGLSGAELLTKYPVVKNQLLAREVARVKVLPAEVKKWGLLGALGLKGALTPFDASVRGPFCPYGLTGLMAGAALVFFAYIGFDSISTHSEEAIKPKRDVPLGIIASLALCTVLYILMAGVITGMEPYYEIDTGAPVAAAFRHKAEAVHSPLLRGSAWLISVGALAGMTSVLLVIFLSQARVFLAMARDGLLPHSIFGVVHEKFRTPHRSTMLTGLLVALAAGFFPVKTLEEMVNIGTLLAFIFVCASVMTLRVTRPDAERPFRCPALFVIAPLGIVVNLAMMLFLPLDTWYRLVVWLLAGLVIYFAYGIWHSTMSHNIEREMKLHGATGSNAPLE